jgi:hypothetical protein
MKRLLAVLVLLAVAHAPVYADSIGVRGAVTDTKGQDAFDAYELFIVFDLPWARDTGGSRLQTQLEITGGVLDAAGETGFLGTLGPRVALVTEQATFDIGAGVAVLGETKFGRHDFGGSSQFVAQAGVSFALTDQFNAGARFRHMSDGGMHDNADDVNLVFLELSYDYFTRR